MEYNKQQLVYLIEQEGEKWLNRIKQNKDKLSIIFSLLNTIVSNLNDIKYINSILRCLKKLNDEVPELVKNQILSHKLFSKALIEYYTKISIYDIIVDGLILLSLIFEEKKLKQLADGNQKIRILGNFEYFRNGEIFLNLTLIIMKLSSQADIIDVCVKHKNIVFILEQVPKYINKFEKKNYFCLFLFLGNILEKDGNIFHPSDFKTIQQLCIRHIYDGEEYLRQLSIRNMFYLVSYGNRKQLMISEIEYTLRQVQYHYKDAFSVIKSQEVLNLL